MRYGLTTKVGRPPARLPARRPPARRTDTFSKSDNNTLRQILAEGKKWQDQLLSSVPGFKLMLGIARIFAVFILSPMVHILGCESQKGYSSITCTLHYSDFEHLSLSYFFSKDAMLALISLGYFLG